jgi:hypothetical protein
MLGRLAKAVTIGPLPCSARPDPIASGRTGGLREARAEGALLAYVEGRDWPSGGGIGDNG